MPANVSSSVRYGGALDGRVRRDGTRARRREGSEPRREPGADVPRELGRRVQQVVAVMLADGAGSPDIRRVADTIGTSVRTLQRRLQATGITYGAAVDRARSATARHLLATTRRRI